MQTPDSNVEIQWDGESPNKPVRIEFRPDLDSDEIFTITFKAVDFLAFAYECHKVAQIVARKVEPVQ